MTLPKLPSVADIHARLERLFTPGLEMRKNLVREMAAKTVFVFLYGGMVDGADSCLRPSHVYFFTEDQAQKTSDENRLLWLAQSKKPGSGLKALAGTLTQLGSRFVMKPFALAYCTLVLLASYQVSRSRQASRSTS